MMYFNPNEFDFQGIIYENSHISCEEFKRSIFACTEYIKRNNNKNRSPFIYLVAENHPKTVIAYFAILQAECSCVLIDPDWKTLEWEYMLSDIPPSAIIKINQNSYYTDFQKDIEFLPNNPEATFEEKRGYTIVYTAAEDGFAKGAMLTQKNIYSNALVSSNINNSQRESVSCALLPFSHMFGVTMGFISPILSHSTILILNVRKIDRVDKFSDDIEKNKVTHLYTIPIILFLLGRTPSAYQKLQSLKFIVSGGYKLNESMYSFYKKKFNKDIHEGYGLTEASPICSWHYPGDEIKIDSVGRFQHYCKMKVVDDSEQDAAFGMEGEICVQGDNVMEGYYKKETASKLTLGNGWLHTGDIGKIDKNGYVYLTGLKKNMVNVGGRNVYPEELKRFFYSNIMVKSVELTYADSFLTGTKISANIALNINSSEVQNDFMKWCVNNIASYKLPKEWEF